MQKQETVQLKREVGVWGLSLNAINLTIGAGIFILPAIVAEKLGPASFIAYLFCAILIILIMLCFAEVGSKVTTSGGAYAYVDAAFGPLIGFIINTLFWLGYSILADAAIANALFDLIKDFHPLFQYSFSKGLFILFLYGLFAFVNIVGVKSGIRFVMVTTIVKMVPLVLIIVIGLFHISKQNIVVHSIPEFKTIGETSLILLFAFFGAETALSISGEIKNPNKTIPKAIFISISTVVLIYLLTQFVAQGVLGKDLLNHQAAPLIALAVKIVGPIGSVIILIASFVSMFSLLSGDVLATSRVLFAASEKKLLPVYLSKLHPKFATPYISILFFSFLTVLVAVSGSFTSLAILSSSSILIIFLAVVLATIKLRFTKSSTQLSTFKIPFGLTIPLLSIAVIIWFLSNLKFDEFKALIIFIVLTIIFYFFNKIIQKRVTIKQKNSH
ncbi:MAG: amino acid permease [Chitinophagaceae bacterium]|nr:amino acid permease [Chitinophagaceae bacterium]